MHSQPNQSSKEKKAVDSRSNADLRFRSAIPPHICSQPERKKARRSMVPCSSPSNPIPFLNPSLHDTRPKSFPFSEGSRVRASERKLSHYLRNVVFDFCRETGESSVHQSQVKKKTHMKTPNTNHQYNKQVT